MQTSGSLANWHLAMRGRGIQMAHPFLDCRLLTFGASLARDVRQEPGRVKPLLAEAMRGILPEPIRTRRYKVGFDRVNLEGLQRALGRLRGLVHSTRQVDPGIFDHDRLEQVLVAYAQGVGNNAVAGIQVFGALTLLAWLQQLADHPPRAGSPTQILSLRVGTGQATARNGRNGVLRASQGSVPISSRGAATTF
jgi:asparagine synthase (glutamine-hydrolysing)